MAPSVRKWLFGASFQLCQAIPRPRFKPTSTRSFSTFPASLSKPFAVKSAILVASGLVATGSAYSYCVEHQLTLQEALKQFSNRFEIATTAATDRIYEIFDGYFPHSEEPLLPDFKELSYPEYLPTLVVNLDKVVAHLEHDRRDGWRVVRRPGADRFFQELMRYYELLVWSDDTFPIAQDIMVAWGVPLIGCLHRDQCKRIRGTYVKDLSRLGRRMDRVVILDHDPRSFMLQPENGIVVREFNGDPNDRDLENLTDLLKSIASSNEDVRSQIKKFGGGDTEIGERFSEYKQKLTKQSQAFRSVGKAFGLTGQSRDSNLLHNNFGNRGEAPLTKLPS